MASLHLAEQTGIHGFSKVVALKRVHPHLAASAELRRMFSTEAKLAARLEHPNIVTVHELGAVEDTYFISMEYLPGEDLSAILARIGTSERMPLALALWIAHSTAHALQYAHELRDTHGRPIGMVHRDVTPSNIMLTYHGVVKLLDFGVAKSLSSDVATREGVFKGKLSYSAPEQLNGEPIDRRADVFCLGIVLWECLTGRRLFNAATDAERIDAVRMRAIAAPSHLRPEVSPALDEVVLRALSRDRNQRYESAHAFQRALSEASGAGAQMTSEDAVNWLELVFGAERAVVKRAIAQGHNVESMIEALGRMPKPVSVPPSDTPSMPVPRGAAARHAPRAVWSTDAAGGSSISSAPMPSGATFTGSGSIDIPVSFSPPQAQRVASSAAFAGAPIAPITSSDRRVLAQSRPMVPLTAVVAFLTILAVAVTVFVFGRQSPPTVVATATVGAIALESEPPGALVFIDGEMTGQRTPAVIRRLPLGREIKVRVERSGMAPVERVLTLTGAEPQRVRFALVAVTGRVRVERVPPGARVYVDGRPVNVTAPLELDVGAHAIRVESADEVIWTAEIAVEVGEKIVEVGRR